MRIGILHGWLLDGSGSNNYVRELSRALTARGHEVHVFCQEPHPDQFPDSGHIHVPAIDKGLMPVYVADTAYEGFSQVRPFTELVGDPRLEAYIARFTEEVLKVCSEEGIEVLHANHVYPMPEVARRVKDALHLPFLVFPHGSAIEYTIKKSKALAAAAAEAIDAADALVVGNKTVTERLLRLYPERAEAWRKKHQIASVGVDPSMFDPVDRDAREGVVALLRGASLPAGGKTPGAQVYVRKAPDGDLLEKLDGVDWRKEKILIYTGKLIYGKGLHDLIAGLPEILDKAPDTRMIIVGEGPYREPLEDLLSFLSAGDGAAVDRWLGREELFENIESYVASLGRDRWLALGKKTRPVDKVLFAGYLRHAYLRHLLPCADIAVFPSEVAEAYPLVLLEAISAGVLPVASYFEGLGEGLDDIAAHLSAEIGPDMRIDAESRTRISSMAASIGRLLGRPADWKKACRALAVERYSWETVAERMERVYRGLL